MISCYVEPRPPSDKQKEVAEMVKELGLDAEEALRLFQSMKNGMGEVECMRTHLAKRTTYPAVAGSKMLKIGKKVLYPVVTPLATAEDDPKRAEKMQAVADLEKSLEDAKKSGVVIDVAVVGGEMVDFREKAGVLTEEQKQVLVDAMGRPAHIWEDEDWVLLGTSQTLVNTDMSRPTGILALALTFVPLGILFFGYSAAADALTVGLQIDSLFAYAVLMIPTLVAATIYTAVAFIYIMNRRDREVMRRALDEKTFTAEVCLKLA